jgi:hypothetical protein
MTLKMNRNTVFCYSKKMSPEIRDAQLLLKLKKQKLLIQEEYDSWRRWHCNNPYCGNHSCYVRYNRLRQLNIAFRDADVKICMIEHNRRYGTNYKVSAKTPALSL